MYRTEMTVRYKMSGALESGGRVTGGGGGGSGGSSVLATAESRARSDAALYGP